MRALLLVSILTLLVSACDVHTLVEVQPASAQGAEPSPDAQMEAQPILEGNFSDTDQAIYNESSQFAQTVPAIEETIEKGETGDIPSLEEREAMLDGVNRGGLVFPESEQAPVGEGPPPGTESFLAPGVQSDDILEKVNQGGRVLTGSDGTVGEGPVSGTESVIGAGSRSNTADDTGLHFVAKYVEMLRNWLQEVLNL